MLSGGVAANAYLRSWFSRVLRRDLHLPLFVPSPALCTDNAAMIAALGYFYWQKKAWADWGVNAYARADFLG
jgi:N6-L-threonylcarbamoyladenine synthase